MDDLTGTQLDDTGPLSWSQRAWAAVLAVEPAALWGASALRAADGPGRSAYDDGGVIHVAVDHARTVSPPAGVEVHRVVGLERKVLWNASPPRMKVEEAVLDEAARVARDLDAVAVIADVVRSRQTTADRLRVALARRNRVARRDLLRRVLRDMASGTCSVLEREFVARVERPHGLPVAQRQFRLSAKGTLYRDAVYGDLGAIVELDGRLFPTRALDRDRDLERDLDAAGLGAVTVRLGWGQVFERPCATAHKVGALLVSRGWGGRVRTCPRCLRRAA